MTWIEVAPGFLAMAVLWVAPGWLLLRLLGVRGLPAAGAGPAVTAAVTGALGILLLPLGMRWNLLSFVLGWLVWWALAALVGWVLMGRQPQGSSAVPPLTPRARLALTLTWLGAGGLMVVAAATAMGLPDQPAQTWDAVYQLNQMWFVRETGVASMFAAAAPMYGGVAPYYPTVWHSIVGITPFLGSVAVAGNVSTLVLGSVVWILGLVALTRVIAPTSAPAAVLVPVAAAGFVAFPDVSFTVLGVWPFGSSVACLPGALAMLLLALRGPAAASSRDEDAASSAAPVRHAPLRQGLLLALAALGACGGVVALHGSGIFSLLALALAPGLAALVRGVLGLCRSRRRLGALLLSLGVPAMLAGGFLALLNHPSMQATLAFERGGADSYLPGIDKLLVDDPMLASFSLQTTATVLMVLAGVGAVLVLVRRRGGWLVVSALICGTLAVLASGPVDNPLRVLAGVWFTQPARLHQLFLVPVVVLCVLGAAALAGVVATVAVRLARGRLTLGGARAAGAIVVVALMVVSTGGLRWATHQQVMTSVYTSWPILYGTQLEPEEIAMVDRAGDVLPEGAVVLGDPATGTPYLLHRAGVQVVQPQLSPIPDSPQRDLLAQRFDHWRTDPQVCEAVRALGVTHLYVDTLTSEDGGKRDELSPGLRTVDPVEGQGFRLLDRGGHASLWEFTGCTR